MKPLEASFGWSRTEVYASSTAFSFTLALSGLISGRLVDHFGVRSIILVSTLASVAAFWALSVAGDDLSLYILVCMSVALVAGGTSAVPYIRLILTWFDRSRGMAIGITIVGTGLTGAIVPPVLAAVIEHGSWRNGYQLLALFALIPLPLMLIWGKEFMRDVDTRSAKTHVTGVTLREAIRQLRFWIMAIVLLIAGASVAGLIPHLVPMLEEFGLTAQSAGTMVGILGVSVIGGRLLTGWMLDRLFAPYVGALIFAVAAAGWFGLYSLGSGFALTTLLMIGFTVGAEVDLAGYMVARYFGMKNYGTIFGIQYGIFSIGCALAPSIAAHLYSSFNGYQPVLMVTIVLLLLNIPLILCLGAYPPAYDH